MTDRDYWQGRKLEDREFPEADDLDDDDADDGEAETVPCPQCGADIYEEAEECPVCGQYVTHSSHPWANRGWWWVVLGLLGMSAVIFSMLRL
jgi:hypothetical protein